MPPLIRWRSFSNLGGVFTGQLPVVSPALSHATHPTTHCTWGLFRLVMPSDVVPTLGLCLSPLRSVMLAPHPWPRGPAVRPDHWVQQRCCSVPIPVMLYHFILSSCLSSTSHLL